MSEKREPFSHLMRTSGMSGYRLQEASSAWKALIWVILSIIIAAGILAVGLICDM